MALLAAAIAIFIVWLRSPRPTPKIISSKQLTNDGLQKFGMVTDGTRIYFSESNGPQAHLAMVSTAGGEVAPLYVGNMNLFSTSVSADGSELLGAERAGPVSVNFWILPLPAGSIRRIGATGVTPIWAPDGRLIYSAGRDIYIANHDGANSRKLVTTPGVPQDLAVSPDMSRIRVTLQDASALLFSIYEVRLDGTNLHPVLPGFSNPPLDCCGRWSPDGKNFFFLSTQDQHTNIWVVPDTTSSWRKAARKPERISTAPLQFREVLPSKDGKSLFVTGAQPRAEMMQYDAKSGAFIPFLGGISAGDLDYTRDHQWMTYVLIPEGTLWRSRVDGSERLQLTFPPMETALAHWSPDGQQIAFAGCVRGDRLEDLPDFEGWRPADGHQSGKSIRAGPHMVSRWKDAGGGSTQSCTAAGHVHRNVRHCDSQDHSPHWLGGNFRAALVARRPLHRGNFQRQQQADALRRAHPAVAPIAHRQHGLHGLSILVGRQRVSLLRYPDHTKSRLLPHPHRRFQSSKKSSTSRTSAPSPANSVPAAGPAWLPAISRSSSATSASRKSTPSNSRRREVCPE